MEFFSSGTKQDVDFTVDDLGGTLVLGDDIRESEIQLLLLLCLVVRHLSRLSKSSSKMRKVKNNLKKKVQIEATPHTENHQNQDKSITNKSNTIEIFGKEGGEKLLLARQR